MIRWHSLRAAVREILAVSKERDAIRVGIIGDMRELGSISKAMHEEVAKKMLKTFY